GIFSLDSLGDTHGAVVFVDLVGALDVFDVLANDNLRGIVIRDGDLARPSWDTPGQALAVFDTDFSQGNDGAIFQSFAEFSRAVFRNDDLFFLGLSVGIIPLRKHREIIRDVAVESLGSSDVLGNFKGTEGVVGLVL